MCRCWIGSHFKMFPFISSAYFNISTFATSTIFSFINVEIMDDNNTSFSFFLSSVFHYIGNALWSIFLSPSFITLTTFISCNCTKIFHSSIGSYPFFKKWCNVLFYFSCFPISSSWDEINNDSEDCCSCCLWLSNLFDIVK